MFKDIMDLIKELINNIISSRIFTLSILFIIMSCILVSRLFNLQIVNGEYYLNSYINRTEKVVSTAGTRGNIYDRNGNILAYNELANSVTIQDTGAYSGNAAKNGMLLKLINILNKHGKSVEGKLEIGINEFGDFVFTSVSDGARNRFLRDYYGLKSVDLLTDDSGKYPSGISAEEIFLQKKSSYELDKMKDDRGNPVILTNEQALQIINIRYTMSLIAYRKYETTNVASYVDEETVAEILENIAMLEGVGIEESTVRMYNDSLYFSHIIGYTGTVQEDQLSELQKVNPDYTSSDIVGRTGIEQSLEYELQGTKGTKTIYVDNMGRIMEVESEIPAQSGKDIYLTIDRDLQVGIYNLIERQLAGILVKQLVNRDLVESDYANSSDIPIPIKDAYYQLINNNVLSLKHFEAEDASDTEKQIFSKFSSSQSSILSDVQNEMTSEHAAIMSELSDGMQAYMTYIYSLLSDSSVGIIIKENIDQNSTEYTEWINKNISLRDFLYTGIANNWIDTTKLNIDSKYSSADDIYDGIVKFVIGELEGDKKFTKIIYRYLINDNIISGKELCLALYSQNVLAYDENAVHLLSVNGADYAYSFLKDKISSIEITPAQLALDPCTGSCVLTDTKTGEVLALVSYPSYDNNRLSGSMDNAYYAQLLDDLSLPLYNNATLARRAPGSTFKPIIATAALEEHVISLIDTVNCTGNYDVITPSLHCWIYPGHHGEQNIVGAIKNSCNFFFGEMGHRLATDENGNYNADLGIEKIQKYASMFGLDHKSGIEINESEPMMSTNNPERSAIGQGTNAYSNIQLSRYTAALASHGNVYELSLVDKITDSEGKIIEDNSPEITSHIDIADSTWNAVTTGMREVVASGSALSIFKDLEVDIAGKTGTAQEANNRANHAYFISFAPYNDPDICVTVNIPYGYSSSNAATVAKNVYRFYYGYTSLESILSNGALDVANVQIGD